MPIPQRAARSAPRGRPAPVLVQATVPATYGHDGGRERIEWLPPTSYRLWRDVGLRGNGADRLPSERFRERWAARNPSFADLMVRIGTRLSEQAHLTASEMSAGPGSGGYQRLRLPGAIAKYFGGRPRPPGPVRFRIDGQSHTALCGT